ncbi:Linker for activation of T-cells family member 2 isoform 3 [Scophthalmus maximus]|uniref:Linker for activation of T-cells family member 2 isoform 3 n=1 Tax=Scophthalmus maximus TaxID=52904 RepID=A0A2U9B8A7_SCOMX|nr:Linker for activation of T-cells family member 2 isoform 3 [Scophthalmus maximus]
MSGNSSLLAAVLTVVSVVSLSLLSLLCLRCKRKSKVIHEELQAYDLPTFQRGGSVFAVMQSKPVTRTNQITSTTVEIPEESSAAYESSDYENVKQVCAAAPQRASLEHTYVAPLQIDVYVNEQTKRTVTDAAQPPDVYANFIKSLQIKDDEDDYENSEFLEQTAQQSQDATWLSTVPAQHQTADRHSQQLSDEQRREFKERDIFLKKLVETENRRVKKD